MKLLRGAKAIILDKNNNALILRRSATHPHSPHHADLPGGVIEENETFEVGLSREILEETGVVVQPNSLRLVYTLTHDVSGDTHVRLLYVTRINMSSPAVTLSYEHDEWSWQPIQLLKDIEQPFQQGIDFANQHNLWDEV